VIFQLGHQQTAITTEEHKDNLILFLANVALTSTISTSGNMKEINIKYL